MCNTENHTALFFEDSFTLPAPHKALWVPLLMFKHNTDWHLAKYRHASVAKTESNSYLCICSLAWWHPTTLVKHMERNTGEYQQGKSESNTMHSWRICRLWLSHKAFLYFIVHHSWACAGTYKSWAVVTEGGFHVSCLLEVVDKTKTQFGADDTGPHEVGRDLLSADEALSGQPQHDFAFSGLNVWQCLSRMISDCALCLSTCLDLSVIM